MFTVLHEWEFDRNRTVRKNNILCLNEECILAFTDLDGLCILEFRPSIDQFNTGILEQSFDTFVQSIDDTIFPSNRIGHLEFSRTWDTDTHVTSFLRMVCEFVERVRCMNECFRRNTSTNQTGSSSSLAFNNDGIHAELTSTNGCNISSWTCTNDQNFAIACFHQNTSHEDGCWVLQHRLQQLNETCSVMAVHNTVVP